MCPGKRLLSKRGRAFSVSASSLERFRNLSFDDFRRRASDPTLSPSEKIGFPDTFRAGRSDRILADIESKLRALQLQQKRVLDIGPGCGELAGSIIERCQQRQHELVLVDSEEMLDQIPKRAGIVRRAGRFPDDVRDLSLGKFDAILCYSVIQYVFAEGNIFAFLDHALSLLADGGRLLLGDIPNVSMRKRFLSSASGARFHQTYMQTDEAPVIEHLCLEEEQIDDGVLAGLVGRCRGFGFHAWIVPQASDLPMANRREDVLIEKP
jgi:2-polyprenyl-3-methyl-5-hydroxy-6-metoxy-1,4-benzoquinol methylase